MLLLRWALNALVVLAVPYIVPGVSVENFWAALLVALVLGVLNALVRPILVILTLPITILTLGLSILVLNGLLVWLASTVVKGFSVTGFLPALLAALVLWLGSVLTNALVKGARR